MFVADAFGVDVGLTAADHPLHEQESQGSADQCGQRQVDNFLHFLASEGGTQPIARKRSMMLVDAAGT